ncbi:hypothetical protein ACJBQ3_10345, partial [Streptococcus suis]
MSGIQTMFNKSNAGNAAIPFRKSRIALFTLLVLYISAYGMWIMFDILNSNSMTLLEYALLALFSITFTWIVT